jgi:hypothetical protein
MKIFQPMLFVGLGGTGCRIGVTLERRLREELCGPDGRRLGSAKMPYELPSCVQFVYADLNEEELHAVRRHATPGDGFVSAVDRTQHRVGALVPHQDSYPRVAQSLRLNAESLVESWLPPAAGEPKVAPLMLGAGQLPTVGRAALFETLRLGRGPAQQPLLEAIKRISTSAPDLQVLSGREGNLIRSVDVFVAFSVAGGTGGGIFYDYLHLIGDALRKSNLPGQIYPLVVMPSAFDEGLGGGRKALLNSGRALLDLFRLVDAQNAGDVVSSGLDRDDRAESVSVRYPSGVIRLSPSMVRTGFLFSRTAGVERDDLHRLIVALMLSLIAAEQETGGASETTPDQQYQSFTDNFINDATDREMAADTGIGNRGVSTGLVASMTVPVEQLADIVASQLLAEAVDEMSGKTDPAEANGQLIDQFFAAANLGPLRTRAPLDFAAYQLPNVRGADAITGALNTRMQSLVTQLKALEQRLPAQVSDLAGRYDPSQAVGQLLSRIDVFRLRRVVFGDPALKDPRDRIGFLGLLERYAAEPQRPEGVAWAPPQPPTIKNSLARRPRSTDEVVKKVVDLQTLWYQWRSRCAWQMNWGEQAARWRQRSEELKTGMEALAEAFQKHRDASQGRFDEQAADLYRPRTAVCYLLPSRGGDLHQFYNATRTQIMTVYSAEHRAIGPAAVVREMLGADGWQKAYVEARDRNPDHAVSWVRERLKERVTALLRPTDRKRRTLVPSLADLLAAAAGRTRHAGVADEDLTQFRGKLAGLLPAGFAPQGSGPMKVLISYAASGRDPEIEDYLKRALNLPAGRPAFEFRAVDTDTITVVLFRTSMSVIEVSEVREVMSTWAAAVRDEQPRDLLKWRQRLGYDFGYLATTPEHRVNIMHRLLCAAWNGWVNVVEGDPDSPDRVRVDVTEGAQVPMVLDLTPFGRASSWGSLLRAYEEWTIHDDQGLRRDVCAKLMGVRPIGLDTRPRQPSETFLRLVKIADVERARTAGGHTAGRYTQLLHEMWNDTFPKAMTSPFAGANNPLKNNLQELMEEWAP